MTKEKIKKWEKEIAFWANGGTLWGYSPYDGNWFKYNDKKLEFERDIYVIEDEYFEARKADALGEPIEHRYNEYDQWEEVSKASWLKGQQYRSKLKEWYNKVSEDTPILCWVKDEYNTNIHTMAIKIKSKGVNCYFDIQGMSWDEAIPVKPEECWKGK